MRKVFWQISTTLDGYMEDPERSLKLTAEVEDEEFISYASEMLGSIDAFIIGRKTYELFVGYWPTAPGRDAEILNSLPKYVVSTTLESLDWNNAELIGANFAEAIGELKNQEGGDLAVFGSSTLAASMLELGLIDELRILVTPYLLGNGSPTFRPSDGGVRSMSLTGSQRFSSGTMFLNYEPGRNEQ